MYLKISLLVSVSTNSEKCNNRSVGVDLIYCCIVATLGSITIEDILCDGLTI